MSFLGPQQPIKISDQDEGHLKRRALLNKHFSKNKTQISPMRKQNWNKKTTTFLVEANARNMYAKYQLHKANSF